jgi:hypothetical protein
MSKEIVRQKPATVGSSTIPESSRLDPNSSKQRQDDLGTDGRNINDDDNKTNDMYRTEARNHTLIRPETHTGHEL